MTAPAGGVDPRRLCQIEIQVSDLERSVEFYGRVFGWRRLPADLHEYCVLEVPEGCPFGISLVPQRQAGPGASRLTLYFASDAPEVVLQLAPLHGGTSLPGPTSVAGYGVVYLCEDPDGTRFGLYSQRAGRSSP